MALEKQDNKNQGVPVLRKCSAEGYKAEGEVFV